MTEVAGRVVIEVVGDLADIETSVRTADQKVAAASGRMVNSLGKVEAAQDRLSGSARRSMTATERMQQYIDRARQAQDQMTTTTGRLAAANENLARSADRLNGVMANGAGRITAYTGALSGAALGAAVVVTGLIAAASAIARAGDEFTTYRNRLIVAGEDQANLNKRLGELTDIAIRSRTGLEPVVELYGGISKATQEMGKSQTQVARVTETISKAFAANSTSAASAAGAILQLNQAFASGTLRGDELNSVMEGAPALARLIAKEFGVAVGELKSFGEEGKLSADRVFQAFLNGSQEVDSTFNATATTISQASTNAGTALTQLGAELDNLLGIANRVAAGLGVVAAAIRGIAGSVASFGDTRKLEGIQSSLQAITQYEQNIAGLRGKNDFASRQDLAAETLKLTAARAEYDKLVSTRVSEMVGKPPEILLNAEGMLTTARATRTAAKALEDLKKTEQDVARDGMGAVEKATLDANKAFEERAKVAKQMQADGVESAKVTDYLTRSQKLLTEQIKQANDAASKKGGAGRSASAGSGSDAFDNAVQRARDQIEQLKLEAEVSGKATFEVYKLTEAHRLRRAAMQAGRADEAGVRDQIDAVSDALARQRVATEAQALANRQLKESFDFVADSFKSFAEDILTGTDGINGALKNLGKGFLSSSLDALISGKGPLAGITGLAPSTKDGQGGILGILATLPKAVQTGAEKGSQAGTVDGVVNGLGTFGGSGAGGAGLFGIDSKQLAGGLTAIAGLAGAYGTGAAAGSYGQAVGGGAISGAMAGASLATGLGLAGSMALPGIGLVLGAGLAYYGQQQARKQAKEQREREAQDNYKNAQPAIATMRSQLRGDPQNTLKIQLAEAEAATRKLTDVMYLAGKLDEATATYLDFQSYSARVLDEFRDGFVGMLDSMQAGLGPNSPFANSKSAVSEFGKELQGFIDNAKTAFGDAAPQVQQAREAAAAYALSVLDGGKTLTLVQQRMAEIQGTGAGLVKVLVDLGWESERAGEAVRAGMTMAIQRVRDAFETDLQAKTNDALDKGYLNDARTLLLEIQQLATDSRALGTDPDNITRYFQAAAQNLVDEANLTGDAFNQFLVLFPEFAGNVVAAGRALEDASRRLGYIDRLFNATNDNSTLGGQLAAYDRQAMRDREEEVKLGGQYILELEAAQQAERFNIIRDFNQAANDNYRQSLQQAQDYVARFTRSIQEYLDGLRAGSDSPLSPQARLAAAQSQYNAQLTLAQGGDRNALDGITSYASDLLDAAKGFFASSTGFQDIFAQIQSQLGALPSQLSAEQFIVNAIEAGADQTTAAVDAMKITLQSAVSSGSASATANALATYFNNLDSSVNGLLSYSEFISGVGPLATQSEQAQARSIFNAIDANGDGQIDKLEAVKAATGRVESSSKNQELSLAEANRLAGLVKSVSDQISLYTGQTTHWTNQTNESLGVANSSLASLQGIANLNSLIVQNLRSQNQSWGASGLRGYSADWFAEGGYTGPGGKYDPAGIVHKGEIVWSQSDISRAGGVAAVEALRTNDNASIPVMPVPVPQGTGSSDVVVELRSVRRELAEIKQSIARADEGNRRVTVAAAEHVREPLDQVAQEAGASRRAARRQYLGGK